MFDIGFPELLLVSVVMLLVFGPERLPEVLRTVGRFVGGARRSFANLRDELEREVGADEIRREIHNSRIMEDAKRIGEEMRAGRDEVEDLLGRRYAELEESGHVTSRAEADAAQGEASAAQGEASPAHGEANAAPAQAAQPSSEAPENDAAADASTAKRAGPGAADPSPRTDATDEATAPRAAGAQAARSEPAP